MREVDATEATATTECKAYGCTQEAISRFGRYAGLCVEHIAARKRDESETARTALPAGRHRSQPPGQQ